MEKISRYPIPNPKELPEDIQEMIKGTKKQSGFVPNVVMALAHRPAELRAFMTYINALEEKESGLTKTEKELMIVAFSGKNGCNYCVASHGAAYRMATDKNKNATDQVAVNYKEADITPRERAIIDFAMKLTFDSVSLEEADFEVLRSHGLSDEDIWDAAGLTAFFNLSNRMMNFLAVKPDNEFYKMGR